MELYILNENYERIGLIDEADSIIWNKKYNDIGECEIYIPCSEEMINFLKNGYFVYREDDDMFCQIKKIKIETDIQKGDYLIATAKDMCTVLSGRIITSNITYSGKVVDFIKKIINDNVSTGSRMLDIIVDDSNFNEFTETIQITTNYEDVLTLIINLCKTYNYGFRLTYNNGLVFKLYKGVNKSLTTSNEYVEFSPTFANIISSNYEENEESYKNVCYVAYKSENEEIKLLEVYDDVVPSGENRKEVYIDATNTSRNITEEELLNIFPNAIKDTTNRKYTIIEEGQTIIVATYTVDDNEEEITVSDYTYMILIKITGLNTLATFKKTQTFNGSVDYIDSYEYKFDYDIGDIVKVKNEYGKEANAIITEIMESEDDEYGYTVEPKFQYIN